MATTVGPTLARSIGRNAYSVRRIERMHAEHPRLAGRTPELAWLVSAWSDALDGVPTLSLIGGDIGIGKSALAETFGAHVLNEGGLVLTGRTPLEAQELPFAVVRAALRRSVLDPPNDEVERVVRADAGLLGLVFPELDQERGGSARHDARLWLFEALSRLVEALAADHGLLLVLEDVHWADRSSLEFLAFLASSAVRMRVAVVATHRAGVRAQPMLDRLLAEVGRNASIRSLRLEGLHKDACRQLLRQWSPALPAGAVETSVARADGNPWFLHELARAGAEGALPETLAAALRTRLDAMPDATRDLLDIAAVIGRAFDSGLLANVVGMSSKRVGTVLRPALDAALLEAASSGDGDLVFRHALARELSYERLPQGQRAAFHAAIAEALERAPDSASAPDADARIALHWARAGVPDRAFGPLLRGVARAERSSAYAEAAEMLREAVRLWPDTSRDVRVRALLDGEDLSTKSGQDRARARTGLAGLLRRAAEASALAGDAEQAIALIERAMAEDDSGVGAWVLASRRARFVALARGPVPALAAYELALDGAGDDDVSADYARLLVDAARNLRDAGRARDARLRADEALRVATVAGASEQQARTLTLLGALDAADGDGDSATARLLEARRIWAEGRRRDAPVRVSRVGDLMARELDEIRLRAALGQTEEAVAAALAAAGEARRLGAERTWGGQLASTAAAELFELGRWDEAGSVLEDALVSAAPPPSVVLALLVRGRIFAYRGQTQRSELVLESAQAVGSSAADDQLLGRVSEALIITALYAGQPRQAADLAVQRLPAAAASRGDEHWLSFLSTAVRSLADATRLPGGRRDRELRVGRELVLAEVELARRAPASAPTAEAMRTMAEAEVVRLDGDDGGEAWQAAVAAWESVPRPHHHAYAQTRLAEALLRQKGGRDAARAVLRDARETCRGLEATALLSDIIAVSRRARLTLADADGPENDGVHARLGLSTREFEVLQLVADGLTNRQIAERLFITEKTAGHHVSSILGKLGASSRVEAAAIAHRRGAVGSEPHGEP